MKPVNQPRRENSVNFNHNPESRVFMTLNQIYPQVIKHGLQENQPFSSNDFPSYKPSFTQYLDI